MLSPSRQTDRQLDLLLLCCALCVCGESLRVYVSEKEAGIVHVKLEGQLRKEEIKGHRASDDGGCGGF